MGVIERKRTHKCVNDKSVESYYSYFNLYCTFGVPTFSLRESKAALRVTLPCATPPHASAPAPLRIRALGNSRSFQIIPRIAKQMAIFQYKIIIFQGQISVISAYVLQFAVLLGSGWPSLIEGVLGRSPPMSTSLRISIEMADFQ